MRNACHKLFILSVLVLAGLSSAMAREPIEVTVGGSAHAGFTSIEDMIDSFENDPLATYGIDLTDIALTPNITIDIDILGFQMNMVVALNTITLTFTDSENGTITHIISGGSRGDVFAQLEDFFESDAGRSVFAEYVKAMQSQAVFNFISGAQSPVGQSVRENTIRAMGESVTWGEMRRVSKGGGNFSIGYEHTEFDTEFFSGETTTIPIQVGSRLNKTVDIQFRLPISWTDLDGTEFYRVGMELDLGIKLTGHRSQSPFEWEVTPTVGNWVLGTSDLMIGGDIYNYGLQNRFQWNSKATSISYGAYWGQYESMAASWGDLDVDLNVDEEIFSHGLKVAFRIGQNAVFDIYGIQSRPRNGIGYREVQTLGAMFHFRAGPAIIQVGYAEDEGQDAVNAKYEATRWVANALFRF